MVLCPSLVKEELQGVKQKNYIDSKNNKHTHDEEHIFGMLLIFVLIILFCQNFIYIYIYIYMLIRIDIL